MHAGFVGRRRDDAALPCTTDDDGPTGERRVASHLARHEERIHVDVQDGAVAQRRLTSASGDLHRGAVLADDVVREPALQLPPLGQPLEQRLAHPRAARAEMLLVLGRGDEPRVDDDAVGVVEA